MNKIHTLESKFNPKDFEDKIYKNWEESGYFKPSEDKSKKPYTIVIPPPNITGKLHMGHALDETIQDLLIRYKRMQGYNTLWLPGTDHAAIATEAKVVAKLKEEGISKEDLGREEFLNRAWEWKKEYGGIIINQIKKLGCSCDWDRERFTMDEGLSNAVKHVFVELYNKGLIYKGKKMINWCPYCKTSISDAEVEYEEEPTHLWHIKYKVKGEENRYVIVATTRPETMLGDTGVAVHPADERYKDLVGKTVILPIMNKEIPVVADEFVEKEFGTGAVKLTPAHDPNDYESGERHGLEVVEVFDETGKMNDLVPEYEGMDLYEAREKIVEKLKEIGALVKIEDYTHNVGKCYRCHHRIEPKISEQWFVKMDTLAKPAIDAVRNGEVKFIPERFDKTYFNWMENIRDWCISRQLWWGHRIPAYYCKECGNMQVSESEITKCNKCGSKNIEQDDETLDTWFSSALWPFSTLGWPEQTEDFKYFYPTDTLVTGYDIIFFWVSRMIFQSLEFTGQRPFEHVLIHGLIRDEQGRKMSKSLGNGVDPMDVIDQYGADTLRFFLTTNSAPGMDLRYIPEKLEASWNFINKIWNSARFVLMNIDGDLEYKDLKFDHLNLCDKWILNRLNNVIEEVDANMDKFEFVNVGSELYKFIWDDFCSWYIELTKVHLNSDNEVEKQASAHTLVYVLNAIVRMLHPFMPFVTEEIYQAIPHLEESICISKYPTVNPDFNDENINKQFTYLMDIVKGVREIRANYTIKNAIEVEYSIETKDENLQALLDQCVPYLKKLCNATCVGYNQEASKDVATAMIQGGNTLIVELGAYVDKEAEKQKLQAELQKLEGEIKRCTNMLSNEKFVSKAPQAKVDSERQKLEDYTSKYNAVKEKLAAM